MEEQEKANCETAQELMQFILDKAGEDGCIQATNQRIKADFMANNVGLVVKGTLPMHYLTRNYGIRDNARELHKKVINDNQIL